MQKDKEASQYAPLTQQEDDGSNDDLESPRENAPEQRGSMRRLFGTKHYPALFGMGLLFDGARFSLLFLASLCVFLSQRLCVLLVL